MRTVSRLLLPLLLLVFCLPVPAQANVGLPMVVPMGLLMIAALVPIIGVEAWVLSVRLDVGFGTALLASGAANAVSTIVGVPLNWFLGSRVLKTVSGFLPRSNAVWKTFVNIIRGNLFWLLGSYTEKNISWIIPSAELVLLVPLFLLSWLIESLVVSGTLETTHADQISGAVFLANLLSYGLLALVPAWFLIQSKTTLLAAIRVASDIRIIYKGLTPEGRRMTADQYGTIRFFDAQTGEQVEVFSPVRAEVVCQAVSLDGYFSLVSDERGHAVWNNTVKAEICRLEDDDYFDAVAFSPDAQYVAAVAESEPAVRLWSCQTGRLLLSGNVNPGYPIVFSPGNRTLSVEGREVFVFRNDNWELSQAFEEINSPERDWE